MSDMENTFSFGQGDGHIGSKSKAWKAEGGNTYRLSFAWWPLDADGNPDLGAVGEGKAPLFSGGLTNFIQGVGYVMNTGAEYTTLAGERPRQRIATVIIIWPTDKKGALDKARLANGDFEVKPWVISSEKYKTLELLHHEFSFGEHDITAKCDEGGTQYQKLTFTPSKENLYRQLLSTTKMASVTQRIKDEVAVVVSGLQEFVGRKMTIQQIREKLNQSGGSPVVRDSGDAFAASAGNIESLVGGLLDE